MKLWFRISGPEGVEGWGASYSGFRVIAARNDDGTILVTYIGIINTIVLNIFGSTEPGTLVIGPAPNPTRRRCGPRPS